MPHPTDSIIGSCSSGDTWSPEGGSPLGPSTGMCAHATTSSTPPTPCPPPYPLPSLPVDLSRSYGQVETARHVRSDQTSVDGPFTHKKRRYECGW